MQHQQQIPLVTSSDAAVALQVASDFPQFSLQTGELVVYALQCALPFLLLASLFVDLLFILISKIGDKMAGWSNIEDDMEDMLLSAVKLKKARRRRKKEAEQEAKTLPRKSFLFLSNIALLLLSLIEGILFVVLSSFSARAATYNIIYDALFPVVAAVAAYTWYSIKIHHNSPDAVAASISLKVAAGMSLVFNLAITACLLAMVIRGLAAGIPFILFLVVAILRAAFSTFQVLAYHPKLREAAKKIEKDVEDGVGNDTEDPATKTDNSEAVEDADDDDEERKKRTVYNWPSTIMRFKRLMPFLLPGKSRLSYVLIAACLLLEMVADVAVIFQPQQFGIVVSDLVANRSPWRNLIIWSLMRLALNGGTIGVLRRALWNPVRSKISRNMDTLTFQHVLELGMLYHNNKRSGEVLSVLSRGGTRAAQGLEFLLFNLAPHIVSTVGSAAIIATHFGQPVVIIVAMTAIIYLVTLEATRGRQAALRAENIDRTDHTSAIKTESISNVELLKYFGMESYEVNRYSKALLHTQKADWDVDIYTYTVQLVQDNVQIVGTVAGAWLIARQVYAGELEVGVFVMYLTYMGSILSNLENMRWMSQYVNDMLTTTDKLMDILDEKNEIVDAKDAVELYECNGQISFENVTLVYPEKGKKSSKKPARKALDNVSFTVLPGQHVALVGETGAGKSTIFKVLYRFFEPQEGCVKVEGKDIRQYTQRSLRQALGVVQQEGMVFNDSIFANILYGDITAPDEKVMEAAKMAQIHDRIVEWPKGYQTVVGERGVKLSGGEKQRVNIARTILKDPKILLLDEATSALDSNTEKAIQGQLRRLTRGKTTIAIAHRLSTIAHADKIIVMDKGKVVETGTHDELLKIEDGFYKKLWETQTSGGKIVVDEEPSMESAAEVSLSQSQI